MRKFGGRTDWRGKRMDCDGGEDARSNLMGHLDGRLEGELSSIGKLKYVRCAIVIGCNISTA